MAKKKVTVDFIDSHMGADATWFDDANVPEMPPIPETDDPPPPDDNWLNTRYWDGLHPPKKYIAPPRKTTEPVTEENPLKADVVWSMRSPYSYLALQRLVWLNSNYNVDLRIRIQLPIAVRSTKGGSGSGGGVFALWYKLTNTMWDTVRTAEFEGVPFKWPSADPIWQTIHPPHGDGWEYVHPAAKQPYIFWIVRLGNYCELMGKSVDYVNQVSTLIWGDHADHWPDYVKERFNRIDGLDYDEAIKFIQENPDKIDAVWQENAKFATQSGHGGVPLMVFNGEPFFGQDRFYQFYSRLRRNGLTRRQEPRMPSTTKPLTWPDNM
jgi:2-hydroxychromene-2-carboxylate isomerase